MPTVILTPRDTGTHHAEVVTPDASESLADLTAWRLRLSLIRMLARAERSDVQFSGSNPEVEKTQFERARTAFIRFIRSTKSPPTYLKEFRSYQRISIDFRGDDREQVLASHTPKPVPNLVKMFESSRANRTKTKPPSRIPVYLQEAWGEVQHREAEVWQRAVELHGRGYSLKDIRSVLVQEFADGRGNIASWVKGERVPWLLRSFFNLHPRSLPFNKDAFEDPQSGYLLGAIVATVRRLHTAAIRWRSQDLEGIGRLATVMKLVLGVSRKVCSTALPSGLQQYDLSLKFAQFAAAVIDATSASQHIPWHLLKTESHEREFVRALLDFATGVAHEDSGGRRYPLVDLTFTVLGLPERTQEILLQRFGFASSDPDDQVLEAIGRRVGISIARVRDLIEGGLEKIRANLHLKVVRELLVALE